MGEQSSERRKHERYDTQVKISFHVNYDVKTRVRFQLLDKEKHTPASSKYPAVSKNVSVDGLAFTSEKELTKGDFLSIEVYLPAEKEPLHLEGEVVWSQPTHEHNKFDSAVKLVNMNGTPVSESVYWDEGYKLYWSGVLETILGNFRIFAQKKASEKNKES